MASRHDLNETVESWDVNDGGRSFSFSYQLQYLFSSKVSTERKLLIKISAGFVQTEKKD